MVDAVNTLIMQRFRDKDGEGMCTPVSRYIAMIAYDNVGGELIKAVKAVAKNTGNPLLLGWAFELEQLEVIKTVLFSPDDTQVFVSSGNVLTFRQSCDIDFDSIKVDGDLRGLEGNTSLSGARNGIRFASTLQSTMMARSPPCSSTLATS